MYFWIEKTKFAIYLYVWFSRLTEITIAFQTWLPFAGITNDQFWWSVVDTSLIIQVCFCWPQLLKNVRYIFIKCISMSLFRFFPKKAPFTVKCVSFSLRFSLSVSSFVRFVCASSFREITPNSKLAAMNHQNIINSFDDNPPLAAALPPPPAVGNRGVRGLLLPPLLPEA